MLRRMLAFDLDDTLAVTKSPITESMAELLGRLLDVCAVCVISGGAFEQFKTQVVDRLRPDPARLSRLHLMPTSGTRYYRFDTSTAGWIEQYAQDLSDEEKRQIIKVLTTGAKELGYWEDMPAGDIIEDRGSQITYSALGQRAMPETKYAWDPDGQKKQRLRTYAAERLPNLSVRAGGSTSVDVTRKGIDKAYGIGQLMRILHLETADVVFFGDQLEPGGNDFPVRSLGIDTISVRDWQDTAVALRAILSISFVGALA